MNVSSGQLQTKNNAERCMKDIAEQVNEFLDDDLADGVVTINANEASYLLDYIQSLEKAAAWAYNNS